MTAVDEETPAVGFRSERGAVLVAVMSTTSLVALDSTVLATAVPTIVKEIGGFSQFPWLFSIYLLTSAVATPLCGRLADTHGRRPVLLLGIGVFLAGSVVCAIAPGMGVLIAGRAVQGIGAGAVQPVSLTIVGDLYSVAERARVQGYLASVWGMSAVVGPAIGGLFSQYASWRWIFVVNLPVGAAAAWLLVRAYRETITRTDRSIDVAGALALVAGWSLVLLGLLEGGVAWAWDSPLGIGVLAVGVLCLVAFVLVERRAADPVVPLWVFRRPVLVGGALAQLGVGALLIGLDSYVPVFAQGVLGAGAVAAGFALATMTVGWPLAATFAGRLYLRIGFRDTSLAGGRPPRPPLRGPPLPADRLPRPLPGRWRGARGRLRRRPYADRRLEPVGGRGCLLPRRGRPRPGRKPHHGRRPVLGGPRRAGP